MKLIATCITSPLEEEALQMYETEFPSSTGQINLFDKKGIVLFPENSLTEHPESDFLAIAKKYNIILIGTYESIFSHQISAVLEDTLSLNVSVSADSLAVPTDMHNLPSDEEIKENGALHKFYCEDKIIKVGNEPYTKSAIIRIGADIALPFLESAAADLLLIPSKTQHPKTQFELYMNLHKRSLHKNSIILYSPLRNKYNHWQQMGTYDINLNQIGKLKDNYVVLDFD